MARKQRLDRHGVTITSPDRLLFPDAGISKRDLVAYYEAVAEHMLPQLRGRLLTLRRCPRGADKPCFVQQHPGNTLPDAVRVVAIIEESGAEGAHLYVDDLAGLLSLVQLATLEFHGWGSRVDALERPDRLVFDLDPDPDLPWRRVVEAAVTIRDNLAAVDIASWPLLSGGKGIHVVVPLAPGPDWEAAGRFARSLAETLADKHPGAYTTTSAKADRPGRIYLDTQRNERGATAIMPYSTRARAGAPVAMPVTWDELAYVKSAATFSLADCKAIEERLKGGSLAGWSGTPQRLPVDDR